MQRRFRSCERFGKRSVVPCYSYDSRGRQDRPESAERMQEPIKRGGSDAGTDLRPAPTNRPPADRAAVRPAFPTGTAVTAGAGYRNQSTRFKSCSETNYPQPSRALHKNSGTASAKGSSTVRTAINIENQCFTEQTPDFTPKNVKSGVFLYYLIYHLCGRG